ncbi:hypothetical protein GCM10007887_23190 [Methylobacterium haplocladii]|nr:hypothetical protein GCM10007887_23190 [Methylobacterium haplocladii]
MTLECVPSEDRQLPGVRGQQDRMGKVGDDGLDGDSVPVSIVRPPLPPPRLYFLFVLGNPSGYLIHQGA